jgi:hypothetical protein
MPEPKAPMKKREAMNGGIPKMSKEEVLKLLHRRELKSFKFPKDFEKIDWKSIEFLAWKHPSGHRGYILENENGKPRLWVLECDPKSSATKSNPVMCSLCNTIRSGTGTRIFSYRPENHRNKIVGFHMCSDLGCVENVTQINPNSMRETLTPERKRERMLENLHNIVSIFEEANS